MKPPPEPPPGDTEIYSTLAAKILANPDEAVYLKPFMGADLSVKEAAGLWGVSVQSAHYRVTRFVQAGLLEVAAVVPRRGRPIKRYRAVGHSFAVPLELLSQRQVGELAEATSWYRQLQKGLDRFSPQALPEFLRVYLSEDGLLMWDTDGPEDPEDPNLEVEGGGFKIVSAGLRMEPEDARRMGLELKSVYNRYSALRGSKTYVFYLGMAPLPD